MKGFVRTVSTKNFGFIRTESGVDYFFHKDDFNGFWDDLLNDFTESKGKIEVEFEPGEGAKGPRAAQVTRADHPNN